nr:hypothetical protein [Candidatus Sigynarchaeota archaeon]
MKLNKLSSAGFLNVIIYAIVVFASLLDLFSGFSINLLVSLATLAMALISYILIVIWGSQVKRKFIQLGGMSFLVQVAIIFLIGLCLCILRPWEVLIINNVVSWIAYIFLVLDCFSRKDLKLVVLLVPCIVLPVIEYLLIELAGISLNIVGEFFYAIIMNADFLLLGLFLLLMKLPKEEERFSSWT